MAWRVAALVVGVIMAIHGADFDKLVPVPDPFGLGERLALVDYLREQKIAFASANDLRDLRRLYVEATAPKVDAAQLEETKRRDLEKTRLRQELASRYGVTAPPDADNAALKALIAEREQALQERERKQMIDTLERRFGVTMSPESSYLVVRSAYDAAVLAARNEALARTEQQAATQPRQGDPDAAQPNGPKAESLAKKERAKTGDGDGPAPETTTETKKPAASERPASPKQVSPPISTQNAWDNYSSAPSVEDRGIRVSVFLAVKSRPAGILDVPEADQWGMPAIWAGHNILVTSGWTVAKTVVIKINDQQFTVGAPPAGQPFTLVSGGSNDDRLPTVKILEVR